MKNWLAILWKFSVPVLYFDAGVGEAAVAEGAKGAGEAAAATDAASIAGDIGVAGTDVGGLTAAESAAGTIGATEAGIAALPESYWTAGAEAAPTTATDALSTDALVGGLSPDAAAELPQVGQGGADIAGAPTDAASMAGDTGLAPISAPVTDLSTIGPAPVTEASTGVTGGAGVGQSMIDAVSKNKLLTAGLGLNALSAYNQSKAGKDAASQLRGIGAPFQKEGETLLAQYRAGKLNPGDEFNINKWEHEAIAAAQGGPLGKQGGEALRHKLDDIRAQAQAMRDQALQGLLDAGLKASGMAVGPLTNAVTAQAGQDRQFMQAQSGALQSLLLLQALQSRGA